MKAPLVTDAQRAALLENGRRAAAGEPHDPLPVVRLFTPDAHAIWLLASLDVASRTIIWSLVKQMWVRCVPLFHRLHRRLALER